jgi:organic radical activating enzyme
MIKGKQISNKNIMLIIDALNNLGYKITYYKDGSIEIDKNNKIDISLHKNMNMTEVMKEILDTVYMQGQIKGIRNARLEIKESIECLLHEVGEENENIFYELESLF